MLTGTLCPACGEPVMSYGRFRREAEPFKTSSCSSCEVELKRKKSVWFLLAIGSVVVAADVLLVIGYVGERYGTVATVIVAIVTAAVMVLGINVAGWLFVGWERTSTE
jgi:hypothetical protein